MWLSLPREKAGWDQVAVESALFCPEVCPKSTAGTICFCSTSPTRGPDGQLGSRCWGQVVRAWRSAGDPVGAISGTFLWKAEHGPSAGLQTQEPEERGPLCLQRQQPARSMHSCGSIYSSAIQVSVRSTPAPQASHTACSATGTTPQTPETLCDHQCGHSATQHPAAL